VIDSRRTPEDYGMQRCTAADLKGGDAQHNAAEMKKVFSGEDRGAHRDALLMGTSLVLEVAGLADDAASGVALAADTIDGGVASAFLENYRQHFSSGSD
jgi:anthranilate phosphoribosyltransferase